MAPKKRTQDVLSDGDWSFSSLLLSKHILDGLKVVGFTKPSPVQVKSIPLGKCGLDLIVQAKSGTGKTCVFAVVALEMVSTMSFEPQAIVLAPTREIAAQIYEFFCKIGSRTHDFHCNVFIGGTAIEEDKKKLSKCQIVIGTPGRVKSLIDTGLLQTNAIQLFVLDEADKLLEPGSFQDQINWIYSTLPENKQILALSATYPEYLAEHLINYMNEPSHIRLSTEKPTLLGVKQLFITVEPHHLPHVVFEQKAKKLAKFLRRYPFQQCMVFSNYQTRAQMLADMLSMLGWPASCIAGNQSQTDRFEAMKQLRDFKCRVLISTDLTSRGIDCDKVDLVVNLDLPWDTETYLHRIGRAGRFGNYGLAVSFVSRGKEEQKLHDIACEIRYKIGEISEIGKVGSVTDILSSPLHDSLDSLDVQDAQLSGESASATIDQDQSYCEDENQSKFSDGKMNLLDSAQNIIRDPSTTTKDLLDDATDGKHMDGPGNSSNVTASLVELQISSNGLLDHSEDSSRLTTSVCKTDGESLNRQSNSLQPFDFNVRSSIKSIKDLDFNLTNSKDKAIDSSGIRENTQKDALDNENHRWEVDMVAYFGVSSKGNQEHGEQLIGFPPRKSFGLTDAAVLNVSDSMEVSNKVYDSKSLEKSSDADNCQSIADVSEVDDSLEGRSANGKDGEVQGRHRYCSQSDESRKELKEITTVELENMLGNLVCDRLIECGTKMLNDYYSNGGMLSKSTGTALDNEYLITNEAKTKQDGRYERGTLSGSFEENLTAQEAKVISESRNLHESQEILHGLQESMSISYDSESGLQNSESSAQNNADELLLSEETLNESEIVFAESEDNLPKSKQSLLEPQGSFHTSAQFIDRYEAGLCKSKSQNNPEMRESRMYEESLSEDNVKTKSDGKVERALGESVKSVSGFLESMNSGISPLNAKNSSEFNSGPILTNLQATDEDNASLVPTDASRDKGASSLCQEKDAEMHGGPGHASFAGREYCYRCSRCDELRPKYSRKFLQEGVSYRKSDHEQSVRTSRFGSKGPLYAMREVPLTGDPVLMGHGKHNRSYGAWYDIYRRQAAWINYYSWQYRWSTADINEMYCKYWQ